MNGHSALDAAVNGMGPSETELEVLIWTLYGRAQANQPSWFTKFCLPWEQACANPTNASQAGFEDTVVCMAISIGALIKFFPTTGPAMNPMLATTWATFGVAWGAV
jgi:hypothetical protein